MKGSKQPNDRVSAKVLPWWLWQAPQNLLGLLLIVGLKARRCMTIDGFTVFSVPLRGFMGVSLGRYILVGEGYKDDLAILAHEYGHCIQSRYLGIAYLPVIGIPSAAMAAMSLYSAHQCNINKGSGAFARHYRERWPESWADRIASRRGIRGRIEGEKSGGP